MENIFVEFLPPWIETGLQPAFYDKESGTVLQQTARMYARVNMLIRMFNKLSKNTKEEVERFETQVNEDMTQYKHDINETVADYIEQFNQLHDYVHDYFDNLDVQEEINNKLDDMLEAGTLQEIITAFISSTALWMFDTVADMKLATNLIDGSFAMTLGYYSKGDSGGGTYKIRSKDVSDVEDDGSIIFINNNLVAELVIEERTFTTRQFGCYGDETHDDTSHFQNCLDFIKNNYPDGCKLMIVGRCLVEPQLELKGTSDNRIFNVTITSMDGGTSGYYGTRTLSNGIVAHANYGNTAKITIAFEYVSGLTLESIEVTSTEAVSDGDIPFNNLTGVRLLNNSITRINQCNITKFNTGLSAYTSGMLYIVKNNFALCNLGCSLYELGDSTLIGNYFNTNGWNIREDNGTIKSKYASIGHNIYAAAMRCGSVGMCSIIGGKCEWNDNGFYFEHCNGINISNVQFDYNVVSHIGITGYQLIPRESNVNITGNRFISGCWCSTASYLSAGSICLWRTTGISITGNTFEADSKSHYKSFSGTNPYYGPKNGFIRCVNAYNSTVVGNTFDMNVPPVYGATSQINFSGNSSNNYLAYSNSLILKDNRNILLSRDTMITFVDGTIDVGDVITKKTDSTSGWKCTEGGSYGTITGLTCTVIDSDILVDNAPIPGDKTVIELGGTFNARIHTGVYLDITGVSGAKKVTEIIQFGYSATSSNVRVFCRLDSACDEVVSNAAVTFHNPTLVSF